MSNREIKFTEGQLSRLEIRPGDKFVLCVDQHISSETAARIRETWERFAGKGVPILILEKGLTLGVLSCEGGRGGSESDRT